MSAHLPVGILLRTSAQRRPRTQGTPPQAFAELCLTLTYQTLGYKLHSGLLVKRLTLHKHLLSMGLGSR